MLLPFVGVGVFLGVVTAFVGRSELLYEEPTPLIPKLQPTN